jgi:serine/threonine protein kinase
MANVSSTPKLSEMRYRVVNEIGSGAGSTILLISDKSAGGKRYALKVVRRHDEDDDVYVAQAQVEYEAARKLNHPAIAKVYDCRLKRRWFRLAGVELLMEYVEGKSLDELEAPEMGQLVLIFCQVASALSHMHRRGVYHGDLKPANVMLTKGGQVKLIDFGTAWIRNSENNRVCGTLQYVAPEQFADKVINERTDIYNFGATMYRMFTGRFANPSMPKPGDESRRKLAPPDKVNPKIPEALNANILACLEWDPKRRPSDMFEIHKQLVAVAKQLGLEEMDLKGSHDE